MGNVISAYIYPHPPIIIPEIGRGEQESAVRTINACIEASKDIKSKSPGTILIITPHGPAFRDAVAVSVNEKLEGNFGRFGSPGIKLEFKNNLELTNKIIEESKLAGIPIVSLSSQAVSRYGIDAKLDHGALVPLYYISKEFTDFKIVHICMGFLSYRELYELGICIRKAISEENENVVIVASGDLSHRLTQDAPCGYNKRGQEFDHLLVGLLGEARFNEIMKMDEDLIETAGECGMRPFAIMFGCLDGYKVSPKILSYEGPFGVGYCVGEFNLADS